jgi:hypothetical protein
VGDGTKHARVGRAMLDNDLPDGVSIFGQGQGWLHMIRNLLFDLFDFTLVCLQSWMPDQARHDKLESDPN